MLWGGVWKLAEWSEEWGNKGFETSKAAAEGGGQVRKTSKVNFVTDGRMDGRTDRRTDQLTDTASSRVACPRLKTNCHVFSSIFRRAVLTETSSNFVINEDSLYPILVSS